MFIVVIWLVFDWDRYYGLYDPEIMFIHKKMNGYQLFSTNILWFQLKNTYPFEYLLAMAAGNTWLKLLLKLRVTKTFGPMFKVLTNMTIDLVTFLVLWIIDLIMFACVAQMIFGQLDAFSNFLEII